MNSKEQDGTQIAGRRLGAALTQLTTGRMSGW
jgi:hypothetical protein